MIGKRIRFLGFPLDVGVTIDDVCGLLEKKGEYRVLAKINPGAWATAQQEVDYLPTLEQMTLVLADGEGVAKACRMLTGEDCQRMSFDMTSLADPFFKKIVETNSTLMLIGSKPGTAEDVREKLYSRYPGIQILDSMHGFSDFAPKVANVMEKLPDAVVVAMGVPRQEKFALALRDAGYKGLVMTCGGFFDQYMIADDYYPAWIDRWDLRWLYRIYKEPRRLWRRYLIDYQIYVSTFIRAYIRKISGKPIEVTSNLSA